MVCGHMMSGGVETNPSLRHSRAASSSSPSPRAFNTARSDESRQHDLLLYQPHGGSSFVENDTEYHQLYPTAFRKTSPVSKSKRNTVKPSTLRHDQRPPLRAISRRSRSRRMCPHPHPSSRLPQRTKLQSFTTAKAPQQSRQRRRPETAMGLDELQRLHGLLGQGR